MQEAPGDKAAAEGDDLTAPAHFYDGRVVVRSSRSYCPRPVVGRPTGVTFDARSSTPKLRHIFALDVTAIRPPQLDST